MKIKCKCLKVTAVFNSEKLKFGKYNNQIFVKYHTFNRHLQVIQGINLHVYDFKRTKFDYIIKYLTDHELLLI
jgi:hypothetical protein